MVAGKNNKNRRAKVTRRAKSNRTKFTKLEFRDDTVRKLWDKTKTKEQNYARLGLVSDPNRAAIAALNPKPRKPGDHSGIKPLTLQEVDFVDITAYLRDPELDYTKRGANFLPETTRKYFKRLVNKYGDNYAKMAADIKINPKQYTKPVCKRHCEKLLALEREEAAEAAKKAAEAAGGGSGGKADDDDDDDDDE